MHARKTRTSCTQHTWPALWAEHTSMCPRNCAAALKVAAAPDLDTTDLDPLDAMRVHPASYQKALDIARAAMNQDAENEDDEDPSLVANALKEPHEVEACNLAVRTPFLEPCILNQEP